MHIRVRNNVAQLIRTTYDKDSKKARTTLLGNVKLAHPELTPSLRETLSPEEIAEFEHWSASQLRTTALRQELAALTLAEAMADAGRWLAANKDSVAAADASAAIAAEWQTLRRTLRSAGLLD